MDLPVYRVRRAIVDDLPGLQALWAAHRNLEPNLEKRITEFQVVESTEGALLGIVAMEIANRQGRIHSEAFNDFANSNNLRQLLWERLQSVATNHGLTRVWTRETAPFWTRNGFQAATTETFKKLPLAWNADLPGWVTLKLRDEEAVEMALDKEFTRFKLEDKRRTQKVMRQAKILNFIGTGLAIVLFIGVFVFGLIWVVHNYPTLLHR